MKTYNKLVRDKIPQIIRQSGKECRLKVLNDEEFLYYLEKKLEEEFKEYMESKEILELADMVEVIYAILDAKDIDIDDFERSRKAKRENKGGFDERIFLIDVSEKT